MWPPNVANHQQPKLALRGTSGAGFGCPSAFALLCDFIYRNLDVLFLYSVYLFPYCYLSHNSSENGVMTNIIACNNSGMVTYSEFTTINKPINKTISPKYCGLRVN